jgi:hypothetical protein
MGNTSAFGLSVGGGAKAAGHVRRRARAGKRRPSGEDTSQTRSVIAGYSAYAADNWITSCSAAQPSRQPHPDRVLAESSANGAVSRMRRSWRAPGRAAVNRPVQRQWGQQDVLSCQPRAIFWRGSGIVTVCVRSCPPTRRMLAASLADIPQTLGLPDVANRASYRPGVRLSPATGGAAGRVPSHWAISSATPTSRPWPASGNGSSRSAR